MRQFFVLNREEVREFMQGKPIELHIGDGDPVVIQAEPRKSRKDSGAQIADAKTPIPCDVRGCKHAPFKNLAGMKMHKYRTHKIWNRKGGKKR